MLKSYKLRIYPNKGKAKALNQLLAYWKDQVNRKIRIFWGFEEVKGVYPPKEYSRGGRLVRDATAKAWQIVKSARARGQEIRPHFKGNEIDLNEASAYIIPEFQTRQFDLWINVISLQKRKRLKLPCKHTKIFNEALEYGKLRKSFKVFRIDDEYYLVCFVELPEKKAQENNRRLGIDVGLNNAIVTSDGKILGEEIKDLRIRTKHRAYKKKSPSKQRLDSYANLLVREYPSTDFVVEDLSFKGKRKRSKEFRRRNNTWAYNHLANRLKELGKLEGFQLIKVNPAYSSRSCPVCRFTDEGNRQGSLFLCGRCGHREHADVVGAINLVERVPQESSVPVTRKE